MKSSRAAVVPLAQPQLKKVAAGKSQTKRAANAKPGAKSSAKTETIFTDNDFRVLARACVYHHTTTSQTTTTGDDVEVLTRLRNAVRESDDLRLILRDARNHSAAAFANGRTDEADDASVTAEISQKFKNRYGEKFTENGSEFQSWIANQLETQNLKLRRACLRPVNPTLKDVKNPFGTTLNGVSQTLLNRTHPDYTERIECDSRDLAVLKQTDGTSVAVSDLDRDGITGIHRYVWHRNVGYAFESVIPAVRLVAKTVVPTSFETHEVLTHSRVLNRVCSIALSSSSPPMRLLIHFDSYLSSSYHKTVAERETERVLDLEGINDNETLMLMEALRPNATFHLDGEHGGRETLQFETVAADLVSHFTTTTTTPDDFSTLSNSPRKFNETVYRPFLEKYQRTGLSSSHALTAVVESRTNRGCCTPMMDAVELAAEKYGDRVFVQVLPIDVDKGWCVHLNGRPIHETLKRYPYSVNLTLVIPPSSTPPSNPMRFYNVLSTDKSIRSKIETEEGEDPLVSMYPSDDDEDEDEDEENDEKYAPECYVTKISI